MFRNLTVKQKIILPLITIITFFAISSFANVIASKKQSELTYQLNQVVVPTLFNIEDAYRDLYQTTSAIQGLALAENDQDSIDYNKFEYEDNAYKAIPRMNKIHQAVDSGVMPLSLANDIRALETLANHWLASYESLLATPQNQWVSNYQANKDLYDQQFVAVRKQLNVVKDQLEAKSKTLQVILNAMSSMNDMNTHIASAAVQQSAVSEEVSGNIVRIASNSAEVVESVSQAEVRVSGLNHQCEQLDRLVSQFKC